jgi:hypothetical protein
MLYLECVVTGVAALFVTSILYMYGYFTFVVRPTLPKMPPGAAVGVDVRVFFARPLYWLIAVVAFAAGCYWMFRRAT